jgi:hypothetical protein
MARLVRAGDEGEKGREVMAETDDVLAELRHRIMGQLKPAQPQHQETPAMTQSVSVEYQRHGSAAIALPAAAGAAGAPFDGGPTGGPRPRWLAQLGIVLFPYRRASRPTGCTENSSRNAVRPALKSPAVFD